MGFSNYGSGYVNSQPLTQQTYSAGATKITLGIRGEMRYLSQFGKCIFLTSCAAGGVTLRKYGRKVEVDVVKEGVDRIVALIKADGFRQVSGHTPKVWHTSESRCESGLLVVVVPGFVFESCNYKRPWRRFRITLSGIEEIPMTEESIN